MAIHFRYFLIIGVFFICLSCNNEKSILEANLQDDGSCTLQATPTNIQSYKGGGGIFILSMTPSEDFAGKVLLSVVAASALHAQISPEALTLGKGVAEVTMRPDTTVALGDFLIRVIATHAEKSDTLALEVKILELDGPSTYDYASEVHNEFIQWVQDEHPELGIITGQNWFSYNNNPILRPGTPGYWTFLNQTWDVTVYWILGPTSPVWILLRPRGEPTAIFAAQKELGVPFHEIPVSEVNLGY